MIRSEEGDGEYLLDYMNFPPCPNCEKRKRVGRNPAKRDGEEATKHLPNWHCYECNFNFG